MASPVGRLSVAGSVGLALAASLAFFVAARRAGEAPWTGILGGSAWVFLLALIVLLPLVTGWAKRRSAGPGPGALGASGERSAMELTAVVWLCTLPFIVLLLDPWLGWRATLAVVLAWAAVMAAGCWMLCTTRGAWSHTRGDAR